MNVKGTQIMDNITTHSHALVVDESPDVIQVARPEWMTDEEWSSARQAITAHLDELVHQAHAARTQEG